jgi:hypothetical protein
MKRNWILAVTLILSIISGGYSIANPTPTMTSEGYLRKLSRRLKGKIPTAKENSALRLAKTKGQEKDFFDHKIDEYLKSPEYVDMMTLRLQELFKLNVYSQPYSEVEKEYQDPKTVITNGYERAPYFSTIGEIFRDLISNNRSLDQLVLGKRYTIYSQVNGLMGISGYGFFSGVAPEQIPVSNDGGFRGTVKEQQAFQAKGQQKQTITFNNDDLRVAGALTSEDFFQRYVNSTINKNRQRAAAIFRIFMCEDLIPSIPQGDSKRHAAMKLAFPDYEVTTDDVIKNRDTMKELLHGERLDCKGCHRKLDPAGKHYQNSRVTLSPIATPGALVYDDENGKPVVIPTAGIGAFAKALVEQPKYLDCQVKHFWSWMIASDINLDTLPELKSKLISQFSANGRRVNDLVKTIVTLPEFKQKPEPMAQAKVTFSQMVPLLARCTNCHSSGQTPLFNQMPFQNSKGDHVYWINVTRA